MEEIAVKTSKRNEMVDITSQVENAVKGRSGVATIYVRHTTAGVTINENADPDVPRDILGKLSELVPKDPSFRHAEGNSDAHIKASLMGSSAQVIVENGKLVLGTWQSIFFCEFDGPRDRKVVIYLMS